MSIQQAFLSLSLSLSTQAPLLLPHISKRLDVSTVIETPLQIDLPILSVLHLVEVAVYDVAVDATSISCRGDFQMLSIC